MATRVVDEAHLRGALERGGLEQHLPRPEQVGLGLEHPLKQDVGVGRAVARVVQGRLQRVLHAGVVVGDGRVVRGGGGLVQGA
jgi:hypothetical protein